MMEPQDSNAGSATAAAPASPTRRDWMGAFSRLNTLWAAYGIYLLAAVFTAVFFFFLVSKHDAFNTRTYDFARFSQAIWGTLQGRLLFSSIDARSILGNHFSPYMALLAPLFWLVPDERVLFFVQAVSAAIAGLLLALIMRDRHRMLAPWFLLAFFLNPALQEMVLFEFRRVVLALPYLALALFAVARQRRWLMLVALLFALLTKEDIGLFVFGVGLFLILLQRDWKWGLSIALLGLGWSLIVSFWVIPLFRTPGTEYPQLYYFDYLGGSYQEIWATLQRDPLILLRQLVDVERLAALWRIFLPLGLFLPFLGADWLIIALPTLLLLLLSGDAEMAGLLKWYPAPILPVLFAAIAIGLGRLARLPARWLTVWLLLAAAAGYWLYSPLPGGGAYDPAQFTVSAHDRQGLLMVEEVPAGASIATQPHYAPHLTQREQLYHYPWIKVGAENVDYFLFDRVSSPYPFSNQEMAAEIDTFLADPGMGLVAETDGIFLFQRRAGGAPTFDIDEVLEETMKLEGFDIAVPDEDGIYRLVEGRPLVLQPGQPFRVDLYWEALAAPGAERTVSLRVAGADGWLHAQHDGLPASGSRPTSWWQPGQRVRDVHALTLAPGTPPGKLALELLVYDTFSQAIIPWEGGQETVFLTEVEVQP